LMDTETAAAVCLRQPLLLPRLPMMCSGLQAAAVHITQAKAMSLIMA
jgi:hypothetical protein